MWVSAISWHVQVLLCHINLQSKSPHIFKISENQNYPILNFSVSYFIWVKLFHLKTNYSSRESWGIPRQTGKCSPFVLFAVIMAAVEPSELEMDTTMKRHRCNLTIWPRDGLSPSPWGLWTQDNSLGTFTDPLQRPWMSLNSCWNGHICISFFPPDITVPKLQQMLHTFRITFLKPSVLCLWKAYKWMPCLYTYEPQVLMRHHLFIEVNWLLLHLKLILLLFGGFINFGETLQE